MIERKGEDKRKIFKERATKESKGRREIARETERDSERLTMTINGRGRSRGRPMEGQIKRKSKTKEIHQDSRNDWGQMLSAMRLFRLPSSWS